jgi:phosphatidylserine/phosphatidylglycerophosphate/cardiolipin synthase-like enzyme
MDQLILLPGARRQAIVDLLRSAKRRAILSLFRCDDSRVLDEIVATSKRGVDVSVLITPRAKGWNKRLGGLVTLLNGTGVEVKQYDGPFSKYHAKYIVVDAEHGMVGSANLTRKCFDDTCDFLLFTREPELVSDLAALFDSDWKTPHAPLQIRNHRLIVGPESIRTRMLECLDRAKSRIRIVDHRISHPDVRLQLNRRMKDGVRVEILGRGALGDLVSHGKLLLVDDSEAVIGSASLSRPGLDVRREVAISITEPSIVHELSTFFDGVDANGVLTPERSAAFDDEDDEDAD